MLFCAAVLWLCLWAGLLSPPATAAQAANAANAEVGELRLERAEDGLYLGANLQVDLPERAEDALLEDLVDRLAGDLLDQHAKQHRVGVGVCPALARREERRLAAHEVDQLLGLPLPLRVREERLLEGLLGSVGGNAAGHVGQLAQCGDVAVGQAREVLADRVVERNFALFHQLQQDPQVKNKVQHILVFGADRDFVRSKPKIPVGAFLKRLLANDIMPGIKFNG